MKVVVTLTREELERAAIGGVQRRLAGMYQNRRSTHPETPDHLQQWWESNVIGAIGELAVAKALDMEWDPTIGRVDCHDVGPYEVRTTQQPTPVLRYRTHNDPNNTYILCQYRRDRVLIHGWLKGRTVLDLGYMEHDDVYVAGADQLYSITDLPEPIAWSDSVKPYQR
jgi:hypothetical protein